MVTITHNGSFGELLRQLRGLQGLSRRECASRLRTSASAIERWEQGESCPSYNEAVELVNRLGFEVVVTVTRD